MKNRGDRRQPSSGGALRARPDSAPALMLLRQRGVHRTWVLWWFLSWTAAVLCSRVAIPRISPGTSATDRALEQLGAIGLCIPVALIALLVQDRAPWLTRSSARSVHVVHLASTGLIAAVGLSSAALAAAAYPDDVRWVRVVSLFALVLGSTLLTGEVLGRTWAALPGPALVVLASVRGVVPWEWNVVYNPATDTTLITVAVTVLAVALVMSAVDLREDVGEAR